MHHLTREAEQGLGLGNVSAQDFFPKSLHMFVFELGSTCCIRKHKLNGLSGESGSW